jgi:LysR family hca operon transcriptional activator
MISVGQARRLEGANKAGCTMDQRYLRYFIAVAEELNFTRVAERLHTVQPPLSQQMRRLEEIVGTPLFFPKKRHLELTEAGRVFLERSREILESTDRAIELAREAAPARAGHIILGFVGVAETKVLANILPVLLEKCPNIHFGLGSLSEPELLASLRDHTTNVAFMAGPIDDPEFVSEVILRQKMVAVLPAGHPLAQLKRMPLSRIVELPYIRPAPLHVPAMSRFIDSLAEQQGLVFKPSIDVDNLLVNLNLVGAGLGFCILPEFVVEVLPRSVTARPLDIRPEPIFELLAVYRTDVRVPAVKFFLNLLRERMKQ